MARKTRSAEIDRRAKEIAARVIMTESEAREMIAITEGGSPGYFIVLDEEGRPIVSDEGKSYVGKLKEKGLVEGEDFDLVTDEGGATVVFFGAADEEDEGTTSERRTQDISRVPRGGGTRRRLRSRRDDGRGGRDRRLLGEPEEEGDGSDDRS